MLDPAQAPMAKQRSYARRKPGARYRRNGMLVLPGSGVRERGYRVVRIIRQAPFIRQRSAGSFDTEKVVTALRGAGA